MFRNAVLPPSVSPVNPGQPHTLCLRPYYSSNPLLFHAVECHAATHMVSAAITWTIFIIWFLLLFVYSIESHVFSRYATSYFESAIWLHKKPLHKARTMSWYKSPTDYQSLHSVSEEGFVFFCYDWSFMSIQFIIIILGLEVWGYMVGASETASCPSASCTSAQSAACFPLILVMANCRPPVSISPSLPVGSKGEQATELLLATPWTKEHGVASMCTNINIRDPSLSESKTETPGVLYLVHFSSVLLPLRCYCHRHLGHACTNNDPLKTE